MTLVEANNARFPVADSGGTGPAVLFLHGNLMDHTMWDGVVEALDGYRCIRFDFRLHGATVDDALPFTYWDAAHDALAILDRLDVPGAHVVGHSQGGFTALRAALLAPARVKTLTLIDTAATAFPGEALQQMAQIRDGFAAGAVEETGTAVLGLLLGADQPSTGHWLARLRQQPARRLSTAVGVLMGADDIAARLAEITMPATVIHGAADLPIPPDAGTALASALPSASAVRLLDGVAHTPPVTHAADTADIIADFLHRSA
ncbi:alpha/beta hydrolase [Amycolatopsis rhizosphaerae]|uniref:Alpha/beta hydrolase n=1 Tax=Amycolatopsis rhizosphaerae TaxID=2053003 RepID=A0A558D3S6_9PSEU|nr:alpha/beta hydrolase [Amycolatopsis rhizosphaerae]TVT55668.1 alpha/beta hydrolase [Amycolatopsis rhizosphaerae]